MARRIVRLTRDNLGDLPVACRGCVFWELDPVRRARAGTFGEAAKEKEAWVSQVLLEWGSCGRVAYVDGDPAGYILYAPPAFLPGAASLPTAPVSSDAVLLATAYVAPEYDGQGIGRVLMQAMARELIQRGGIEAVEAFGTSMPDALVAGRTCVVPTDFLLRVGFRTHRAHPAHPRLRLDLSTVLTWREEVEAALERLVGVVRPAPAPQPTARSSGPVGRWAQ